MGVMSLIEFVAAHARGDFNALGYRWFKEECAGSFSSASDPEPSAPR